MKRLISLSVAALLAATPALAAEEEWIVVGGDGQALGYDRASVSKDAAGVLSIRHGGYSIRPIPAPATIGGGAYNGMVGEMKLNCKDKTVQTGATTFITNGAPDRPLDQPPAARFAPLPPQDPRAFIVEVFCGSAKPLDPRIAVGRAGGVALMKQVAGQIHVPNTAAKGWALALANPVSLMAIDTNSAKKAGNIVTQTELLWLRKDQTTNGQAWRYNQITYQYDCASGKRRPDGQMQIYASDNSLVHEEVISNAPWSALPDEGGGKLMLDMVCGGRKLPGLPVPTRQAMVARLRELAVLM